MSRRMSMAFSTVQNSLMPLDISLSSAVSLSTKKKASPFNPYAQTPVAEAYETATSSCWSKSTSASLSSLSLASISWPFQSDIVLMSKTSSFSDWSDQSMQ